MLQQNSNLRSSDAEIQQRALEYFQLSSIATQDVLVRLLHCSSSSAVILNGIRYLHLTTCENLKLRCLQRSKLAYLVAKKAEEDDRLLTHMTSIFSQIPEWAFCETFQVKVIYRDRGVKARVRLFKVYVVEFLNRRPLRIRSIYRTEE